MTENDQNVLFKNLITREERHYCAHLFAWLLYSENAVKEFFDLHSNQSGKFDDLDFNNVKCLYEFTALREYLYHLKRSKADYKQAKVNFEGQIFTNGKGDVQKKKPDLAFYFEEKKTLVVVEAKFEGGFDAAQIKYTQNYGEALREKFKGEIDNVHTTLLGLDYHLGRLSTVSNYPHISWETIFRKTAPGVLKSELKTALDYQKTIHRKVMSNWTTSSE